MYLVEYLDRSGVRQTQEIVGITEQEIRETMAKEGKVCISVKKQMFGFGQSKIKKEEIIASFVAIGDLLSSGISLSRAIGPVINSFPKDSKFAAVLTHIGKVVKEGKSFSQGMSAHTHVFGQEIITMIEAGETSGKLAQTFISAGDYIRTMEEVRGELIKKLTYPAILLGVAAISLLLNSIIVIPKLMSSPMFKAALKQSEGKHDMSTKLIGIIQQMKYIVPSGLAIVAAIIVSIIVYYKTNQETCEKYLVKIPVAKQLMFYQAYYVSFLAMSNLMSVGVRLEQALLIAGKANRMITVKAEFEEARKYLKQGQPFTKGISSLNPIERTMLDTAQSLDRIKYNFDLISKRFYKSYIDATKKIAPKVYTLAIVLVCCVIILMLAAIMIPYSKMLSGMK